MLTLVATILKALFLPALAQGPCDLAYANTKPFAVCEVSHAQHRIDLVLRDTTGARYGTLERVKQAYPDAIFLGNAGMYHASGEPVGLFVADKKTRTPLNLTKGSGNFFMKPNGVFWIDKRGFHVEQSERYPPNQARPQLATQSGPLLLLDGARHPAFRQGSKHQKIRNGVGVSVDGQSAFFVISLVPVSFWDMSELFMSTLGVKNALYLDGVVSSIQAPGLRRQGTHQLGPIFVVRAR